MTLSFQTEMNNVFLERTLKLALVLALHFGFAALMLHVLNTSTPELIHARVEIRPIEVSLLAAPSAPQPSSPPQHVAQVHPQPAKPLPSKERHAARPSESAISKPPMPAQTPVEPAAKSATAVANSPATPEKKDSLPAPAAAKPAPMIAAHVDANYLQKPKPTYPTLSRRLHEEGEVQLLVKVTEKGEVDSVQVKESSGFPRLDDVAQSTVRQWHFVPARRGDVAVADSVVVPILFKLND